MPNSLHIVHTLLYSHYVFIHNIHDLCIIAFQLHKLTKFYTNIFKWPLGVKPYSMYIANNKIDKKKSLFLWGLLYIGGRQKIIQITKKIM